MAKVRGQRTAESYISKDLIKRARSRANLTQFRGKKTIQAESVERKPGPFSPVYKNDIIRFLGDHYFIPETRSPVKLESWQRKRIFEPLFELDPETGFRKYSLGLIGLPKKNSKSTMASMIANFFLFQDEEFGEIILTANSKDQSSWIIFSKLEKSLRMNPSQHKEVKILDDAIEVKRTGTVARIVAPNYRTASGQNPSLTLYDELWAFELDTARKFWDELTESPVRKQPLALVFSYAGWDEDSLLYELYQKGLKKEDPKMFFLWENRNLASWITKDYLRTQKKRLRPNTYLRLHENRWTSSESAFIPLEQWDGCVDRTHKPLIPGEIPCPPLYVSIDIGVKHDSSAVVGVYRDRNLIKLALAECWIPSKKQPLDIDESIGRYLRSVNKNFNLKIVYYDPYQCHQLATELKKEGIRMEEFPQTTDRLTQMGQNLYNLITGGNLLLYPHKEMRKHAEKTLAKETQRGFRLIKGKASQRIDLIIALAMCCQGCVQKAQSRPGRVYIIGE